MPSMYASNAIPVSTIITATIYIKKGSIFRSNLHLL